MSRVDFAFTINNQLTFLDLEILKGLKTSGSSYGMDVSYLASRVDEAEYKLYVPLTKLLACGLVGITVPEESPRPDLDEVQTSIKRFYEDVASLLSDDLTFEMKKTIWNWFFERVGDLNPYPRFYVRISKTGTKQLKKRK